eukprot:g8616.t1
MFKAIFGCFGGGFHAQIAQAESRTSSNTVFVQPTPAPQVERTIATVASLNEKEDQLHNRLEILDKKIEQELKNARKFRQENRKDKALLCLKKKKLFENQVAEVGTMITRVVEQKIMLESAQTTAGTVNALASATKATKEVMKGNRIDDVEIVMQNIEQNADDLKDVNERLAEPTGALVDMDDEELMAEFEALEAASLDNQILELPAVPEPSAINTPLPSAPVNAVKRKKTSNKKQEHDVEGPVALFA